MPTRWQPLEADGSDFIVVVAEVTDDSGHVRRLPVSSALRGGGRGCIIDDGDINANPRRVEWGSAPILLRSTLKATHTRAWQVQYSAPMPPPGRPLY
jgi:beta-galactosidase